MKNGTKKQIKLILAYMPTGRDNAVSMRYIAQMTGASERDVRSIVNKARLAGHMIVGDDRGYYLADTDEELTDYYFRLRGHSTTTQSILRTVKGTLISHGIDPDQEGGLYDE